MAVTQFIRNVSLRRERVPDFSHYPFSIPAVKTLDELPLHTKITFFVGENGTGKSTLLEGIAAAFGLNPEGGTRNFTFSTYRSHSELEQYLLLVKGVIRPRDAFFLRAESFYNVATEIERLDEIIPLKHVYGGSLHECSHGESFFALLNNRLGGNGLYIFDEPEAALSPQRQLAMLCRIHQLVEDGSQLLIATHSPILTAYPDCWIYECSEKGIARISYEETENYRLTKHFLCNHTHMLEQLLDEGEQS